MNVGLVFKEQHQTHIHADWVWAPGAPSGPGSRGKRGVVPVSCRDLLAPAWIRRG